MEQNKTYSKEQELVQLRLLLKLSKVLQVL